MLNIGLPKTYFDNYISPLEGTNTQHMEISPLITQQVNKWAVAEKLRLPFDQSVNDDHQRDALIIV